MLVAIRDDFYGRCASYPALRLGCSPRTRCWSRRCRARSCGGAIELPARRVGLARRGSRWSTRWSGEVADGDGRAPAPRPRRWSSCGRREPTDGSDWTRTGRTGGVRGAVARLAEESFERLEGPQREAARSVLLRLTGTGEGERGRRAVAYHSRSSTSIGIPPRRRSSDRFTKDRLLTASDCDARSGTRGAAPGMAAPSGLARGGRAGAPARRAGSPTRRSSGTPRAARTASCTAAPRCRRRSTGRPCTVASSTSWNGTISRRGSRRASGRPTVSAAAIDGSADCSSGWPSSS